MKHTLTHKVTDKKTGELISENVQTFFSIYNAERREFEIEDAHISSGDKLRDVVVIIDKLAA